LYTSLSAILLICHWGRHIEIKIHLGKKEKLDWRRMVSQLANMTQVVAQGVYQQRVPDLGMTQTPQA
jgi:hypothetical protein